MFEQIKFDFKINFKNKKLYLFFNSKMQILSINQALGSVEPAWAKPDLSLKLFLIFNNCISEAKRQILFIVDKIL